MELSINKKHEDKMFIEPFKQFYALVVDIKLRKTLCKLNSFRLNLNSNFNERHSNKP